MLTADSYSSTGAEIDVDYFIASSSIPGADLSWLGTDSNIYDPEPGQEMKVPEADPSFLEQDYESDADVDPSEIHPCLESSSKGLSLLELHSDDVDPSDFHPCLEYPSKGHPGPSFLEQDSESNKDVDPSEIHPCLESPLQGCPNIPEPSSLHMGDFDGANIEDMEAADAANLPDKLPDLITKLQKQLLAGYKHPVFPPINDSRGRALTESEKLSLKLYMVWVDSRGTVKAYSLHASLLQSVTDIEVLSLFMVRKLAMKVLGLSSQMVDMCPRSCMAFTGEFKDLQSCIHMRDKRKGKKRTLEVCGEPRFNSKGLPRAQMSYTPIAPVIQSFYGNREMAEAMRYRHQNLQKALKKLKPNSPPSEYFDFSDSINHINHAHLFQNETDCAISISGDGAQLTMKKQSNVWVLIVTILNLPPNMRTKATNIIIPLVIPGPYSPGNVESFVYVLYEELAKLSVGIWTKDALSGQFFLLKVYLCGVLGDMLGSAKLSKMAGHMALHGCRFCTVQGARPNADKGVI